MMLLISLLVLNIALLFIISLKQSRESMLPIQLRVTFKSAPNIALVKYWGKYSESEIIPINDSIGITLSTDDLCSLTTITFNNQSTEDTFQLNHQPATITNRMLRVLKTVRDRARGTPMFQALSE